MCHNTLENCFFEISFYSRAYVRIIYEKTKGQVPLGPLVGLVYYLSPVCGQCKGSLCTNSEFNRVVISVYIRSPLAMRAVGFIHFTAFKVMDAIFLAVPVNAVPATQRRT